MNAVDDEREEEKRKEEEIMQQERKKKKNNYIMTGFQARDDGPNEQNRMAW